MSYGLPFLNSFFFQLFSHLSDHSAAVPCSPELLWAFSPSCILCDCCYCLLMLCLPKLSVIKVFTSFPISILMCCWALLTQCWGLLWQPYLKLSTSQWQPCPFSASIWPPFCFSPLSLSLQQITLLVAHKASSMVSLLSSSFSTLRPLGQHTMPPISLLFLTQCLALCHTTGFN